MKVQPHLNFDGRCEEALDFYRRALGAEVTALMRFKDSPEPAMILEAQRGEPHTCRPLLPIGYSAMTESFTQRDGAR
jgi:uncharacterized glyoxalase superfamily protein PhnB